MSRALSRLARVAAICLLGAAGLVHTATAAEFITLEDECRGRQLMIQGPIGSGDYARFVDALAQLVTADDLPSVQDPDTLWTVRLDSPGGDADEAMRIGRFLREALATTEVSYRFERRPDGVYDFKRTDRNVWLAGESRLAGCAPDVAEAECAGACVLIWLGGARRRAIEGRLGVEGLPGGPETDSYLRDYLPDYPPGAGEPTQPDLRALAAREDPWLEWRERDALSGDAPELQARLEGCPAALTSALAMESLMTPSAARRDDLLSRADAHRSCRVDRLAQARAPLIRRLAQRADG